jgi:glycosyltransferase involved in cell wall biosynthesis
MLPRISLITPSYQQGAYLAECLASVAAQPSALVEHIVVDGGSTDGSRELLEAAGPRLAWWCSEPDRGQSHAINKGLEKSTGQVFGWLNSDDALLPGALERVSQAFAADPRLLIHGGRRRILAVDGRERTSPLDDADDPVRLFVDPKVNQQSTFYRLDAVRAVGGVDEGLNYVMDLELWWRLLFTCGTDHVQFEATDLAMFRLHEQSKTMSGNDVFRDETHALLHAMAVVSGQRDLVEVLRMGIRTTVHPRPMPLRAEHTSMVRRMVVFFLLKWHHTIHERWQFDMMRAFVRSVGLKEGEVEPDQRERWRLLHPQLDTLNWTTFRMRRKLNQWKEG